MNILSYFYKLCIIANLVSSLYFLMIIEYDNFSSSIANAFNGIVIINSIKIVYQFVMIKEINSSREPINSIKKLIIYDNFIAIVKFFILHYLIMSGKKICLNISSCLALGIVYFNFAIVIGYFIFSCIKMFYYLRTGESPNDDSNNYINYNLNQENYNSDFRIYSTYNLVNYKTSDRNTNIQCAICLENQESNESWSKLICEHEYHSKCVIQWLRVNNVCPVCRSSVVLSSIV